MSTALVLSLAWKSTFIAGIALVGAAMMRRAAARDRALFLAGAVLALSLLPMLAALAPIDVAVATPLSNLSAQSLPQMPVPVSAAQAPAPASDQTGTLAQLDWAVIAGLVYSMGALTLLVRLAAGVFLLRRWTAHGVELNDPVWQAALDAGRAPVSVRLIYSEAAPAPLSWGLVRPVILVDPATAARTSDAAAIVAHESAHIQRHDWPVLLLSRLVRAVFWVNPLVWLLDRALIQQCEEAADARALARCEATDYAAALLACLGRASLRTVPANSMTAGHGLVRRIRRVLDVDPALLSKQSRFALAGTIATLALVVPAMAVRFIAISTPAKPVALAAPTTAHVAPSDRGTQVSHQRTVVDGETVSETYNITADASPALSSAPSERVPSALAVAKTSVRADGAAAIAATPVPPTPPTPPAISIDAGGKRIDIASGTDAKIRVDRVDGPPSVESQGMGSRARAIEALGIDADDALELAAVGGTPGYVLAMRAAGYSRIGAGQLTEMRAVGVTPDYVRKAAASGPLPPPQRLLEQFVIDQR